MIKKVDPSSLKELRPQIESALKDLSERTGLKFVVGKGVYEGSGMKGSLNVEIELAQTADGKSVAQAEFEQSAFLFGLTPEDFGVEFGYGGKRYKVAGLNLNAKKNALIIVNGGKNYTLDPEIYKSFRDLERLQKAKAA